MVEHGNHNPNVVGSSPIVVISINIYRHKINLYCLLIINYLILKRKVA